MDCRPRPSISECRFGTCTYKSPTEAGRAMWQEWALALSDRELQDLIDVQSVDFSLAELRRGWGLHPDDEEIARRTCAQALKDLLHSREMRYCG